MCGRFYVSHQDAGWYGVVVSSLGRASLGYGGAEMGVYALGASVADANEMCMYGWAKKQKVASREAATAEVEKPCHTAVCHHA